MPSILNTDSMLRMASKLGLRWQLWRPQSERHRSYIPTRLKSRQTLAVILATLASGGSIKAQSTWREDMANEAENDSVYTTCYINFSLLDSAQRSAMLAALTQFGYDQGLVQRISRSTPAGRDVYEKLSEPHEDYLMMSAYMIMSDQQSLGWRLTGKLDLPQTITGGTYTDELEEGTVTVLDLNSETFNTYQSLDEDTTALPAASFLEVGNAETRGLHMTLKDLHRLYGIMGDSLVDEAMGRAMIEVPDELPLARLQFSSCIDARPDTQRYTHSCMPLETLRSIPDSAFGRMVVLDAFTSEGTCSHGEKVLDVIRAVLTQAGRIDVFDHVDHEPVNYFGNEAMCIALLSDYFIEAVPVEEEKWMRIIARATLKYLRRLKPTSPSQLEMPELLLYVLINKYYAEEADVITTSFYATCQGLSVLPRLTPQDNTCLVTAAMNESGSTVDDIVRVSGLSNFRALGRIEPLYSYSIGYENSGALIVGNYVGQGQFCGMSSGVENCVSTLGYGLGWDGNCIEPADLGASFATPQVATMLFLAKAFWRSKGWQVTPREARLRLLLASDLDESMIGRFASAGTPNPCKLLINGQGFVQRNDSTLQVAVIQDSSIVELADGERILFGTGPDQLAGLCSIGQVFYGFRMSSLAWEYLGVQNIRLRITTDSNNLIIDSPEQFRASLNQLVTFPTPTQLP
jgi:hypothetical protein